jgi:hypothetical protein
MPYIGKQPTPVPLTAGDLDDNIITQAKMADDAIALAELKAGTDGELISWDASGNPVAIGAGSSGHFLKSQGAGSQPVFAAAGGGSFALQEYKTVGTSAVGSVTFDNLVPFYDYLFTWNAIDSVATSTEDFYMQVSPDGGSTWRTSGYKSGLWVSRSDGTTNGTNTTSGYYISYNQASSYIYTGNCGHCYLQNIDANCKTVMHGQNIVMGQTDRSELSMIGGYYDTTEVTDMVRFLFSSGNISGATAPATSNIACYKQVIA